MKYLVWLIGSGVFISSSLVNSELIIMEQEWWVKLGFYLYLFHWTVAFLTGETMSYPNGATDLAVGRNSFDRLFLFLLSVFMCLILCIY